MNSLLRNLKHFSLTLLLLVAFSCSPEDVDAAEENNTETDISGEDNGNDTPDETTDGDTPDDGNETEEPDVTVPEGAVSTYGNLQVSGNKIISENTGSVVQLRGMSLFWSQWDEGAPFYNKNTIDYLVDEFKINIVRAAIGVDASDGGYVSNTTVAAAETQKAFDVIQAAIDNDIYVIVDWHSHYAHLNDPGNYSFAKKFFTDVYNKFGNVPNIIYEPFNEPKYNSINGSDFATWTDIKPYHEAIINTLRNLGADNLIICGTGIWSQAIWDVVGNEINDVNVAYTLHFYASSEHHQDALRTPAQGAIDDGIPVFITEFGLTKETGDGEIDEALVDIWWAFVNNNNLSWCNWSIVNKNETSAAFIYDSTYNNRTQPLTTAELEGLTLSKSGTLIKAELEKN